MNEGCEIQFRIIPNAKKSEIAPFTGEILKLKVSAPAVEGKANEAVLNFLAQRLNCSPRAIRIVKGLKSRDKRIHFSGISREETIRLLLEEK